LIPEHGSQNGTETVKRSKAGWDIVE